MTKAERMVRYRQNLKDKGVTTVTINISEKIIKAVDMYGRDAGQTRGEALESILNSFLDEWASEYELVDHHIKQLEGDKK